MPEPINSSVPQGSVLSSTLFLLFINDLFSSTQSNLHAYADDSTLHYSTSFTRGPNQQELNQPRLEAGRQLTSDLVIISDWSKRNLLSFNTSKTHFLHISTQQLLPDT